MPTVYPTNFMGNYRLGDNINENLDALQLIWDLQHEHAETDSSHKRLRKPVIVYCGAIAEAVLFDFFAKIRDFVREGVAAIEEELAEHLRSMSNDNFQFFIDQCRKHQLFGDGSDGFYDDLNKLAELRNRIHIQNVKHFKPLREHEAFSKVQQQMAERTLETLIARMNEHYNRKQADHVGGFMLPWNSYL
ncbi:hypothetical protein [Ruegeria lacuscaerulensis]|uniref:hypothetical protein n=1 Tax=Ruegeria lacuscaerulensis TaxID=55218 RepID=UPI00147CE0C0|nr:hypothetical protein [Ruegeria lacuscaerulensis]